MVYCDLHAYRSICPQPTGLFTQEAPGTYCVDLFIGEKDWLNQGYGTKIMRLVLAKLFNKLGAHKVLIDPAITNTRATRVAFKRTGVITLKSLSTNVFRILWGL